MVFAGAGVKPGRVVGSTDRDGGYVVDKPYAPADVSYTILSSLGINPRKQIFTPDGRPVEILDMGSTMEALYA